MDGPLGIAVPGGKVASQVKDVPLVKTVRSRKAGPRPGKEECVRLLIVGCGTDARRSVPLRDAAASAAVTTASAEIVRIAPVPIGVVRDLGVATRNAPVGIAKAGMAAVVKDRAVTSTAVITTAVTAVV